MSNPPSHATRQRASSFSDVLTSEHTRTLLYLLNNTDANTFRERLLAATRPENGCTPEEIEALLQALKGVGFERSLAVAERASADDTPRHCVRCHTRYIERDNRPSACTIQHSYASTTAANGPPPGVVDRECVTVARHTTNLENLAGLQDPHVKSCLELGCFKAMEKKQATGASSLVTFTFGPAHLKVTPPPKGQSSELNESQGGGATAKRMKADLAESASTPKKDSSDKASTSTKSQWRRSSSKDSSTPAVPLSASSTPIPGVFPKFTIGREPSPPMPPVSTATSTTSESS